MIIDQIINNNTILTKDDFGNEMVCFGKGIGFKHHKGDEINKLDVEKTYILTSDNDKNGFLTMVQEIPYDLIQFGIRVTDYVETCCSKNINKRHLLVPLVDHLYTTLERYKEGIKVDGNVLWNIQFLYREEFKIAQDVTDMLISYSGLDIDEGEANFITLHIVNSELELDSKDGYKANKIIEIAYQKVEQSFDITLDKESIEFQRFITHLQFLAKRVIQNTFIEEENDMNAFVRVKYKDAYQCAQEICEEINKTYPFKVVEGELTYLTIHIARLIRETQ